MTKDELTAWALANGWRMIGAYPCLPKPGAPKEALVRMLLKTSGVDLQLRRPTGRWEKVAGQSYLKIRPDPKTGQPMDMGLDKITGITRLMERAREGEA